MPADVRTSRQRAHSESMGLDRAVNACVFFMRLARRRSYQGHEALVDPFDSCSRSEAQAQAPSRFDGQVYQPGSEHLVLHRNDRDTDEQVKPPRSRTPRIEE